MKKYLGIHIEENLTEMLEKGDCFFSNSLKEEMEVIKDSDIGSAYHIYEVNLKKIKTIEVTKTLKEIK